MDIITEHEAKDKILKYLVDKRRNGNLITSYDIWKDVYPEQKEQIVYSVLKTLLYKDVVTSHVTNDSLSNFVVFFEANDLTEMFLSQGGFSKESEELQKVKDEQAHVDQLNKRLLIAEVAIKEFEKKRGKGFVIWGFVIAILTFLSTVLFDALDVQDKLFPSRKTEYFQHVDSLEIIIDSIDERLRVIEQTKSQDTTKSN